MRKPAWYNRPIERPKITKEELRGNFTKQELGVLVKEFFSRPIYQEPRGFVGRITKDHVKQSS